MIAVETRGASARRLLAFALLRPAERFLPAAFLASLGGFLGRLRAGLSGCLRGR